MRLADLVEDARVAAELISLREWHVVLAARGNRYRLSIRRCTGNERLAFLNPADAQASYRAAIVMAFHRDLLGLGPARPPAGVTPGLSERWRLVQWLRLLDAMAEGATSRDIAATLILEETRRFSASEWDSSSERRRMARWQRAAAAMRDGGFRVLLGAP